MQIKEIEVKVIPDSRGERGENTLSCQMKTNSLVGELVSQASVPSGKSTGTHEAFVLKPELAVEKFQEIKSKLLGKDFSSQADFDNYVMQMDGTENKSNLGGNLILVLSLAFARLKAQEEGRELFEYISENIKIPKDVFTNIYPHPVLNVINGGAHAKNELEFQEFQIIPMCADFKTCMELARKFYFDLGDVLVSKFGKSKITLGDEAGYSAPFKTNEEAIKLLYELTKKDDLPFRIGLDAAANYFYKDGKYIIDEKAYTAKELLEYYAELINKYDIISLEDPFAEEDFQDFAEIFAELKIKHKDILIITDDLTTTNPKRLEMAIKKESGDAILVKLNQIGSLTETLEVVRMAYENKWQIIVSHRSGETEDDFIADLSMGVHAWGLKSGAPETPYRMNKYNRVQKIIEIGGF